MAYPLGVGVPCEGFFPGFPSEGSSYRSLDQPLGPDEMVEHGVYKSAWLVLVLRWVLEWKCRPVLALSNVTIYNIGRRGCVPKLACECMYNKYYATCTVYMYIYVYRYISDMPALSMNVARYFLRHHEQNTGIIAITCL